MKNITIFIFGLYFSHASAASFCQGYAPPTKYLEMKKDIDQKIDVFANSKTIATHADRMILKLIEAKSPFIDSWYKKGNFKGKTEEEIARSWRQYFTRSFLLMKYPQGDAQIDAEIEKLVDGMLAKNFDKKFKEQVEKDFSATKTLAIETITEMKLAQNKALIEKIKSIKLYWPSNLKTARNNSIPLDLIDWGIAYDPISNEINIGLNSLSYSNDQTLMAVFAHEIGHSFDSCRWSAFYDGVWPFEKVGQCLRSDKSVGAKTRDDSKLEAYNKAGRITAELVVALKANPTCNKMVYPPAGVQADQLPETFADWFSAEVISRHKNLDVSKLRLDLCEEKSLMEGSSYPANDLRQEKIYFSQPAIKKLLKDKAEDKDSYCSM